MATSSDHDSVMLDEPPFFRRRITVAASNGAAESFVVSFLIAHEATPLNVCQDEAAYILFICATTRSLRCPWASN